MQKKSFTHDNLFFYFKPKTKTNCFHIKKQKTVKTQINDLKCAFRNFRTTTQAASHSIRRFSQIEIEIKKVCVTDLRTPHRHTYMVPTDVDEEAVNLRESGGSQDSKSKQSFVCRGTFQYSDCVGVENLFENREEIAK